jgi:predicted NAD-dependent protein-ADP-ribosyltransferase YbiA (DUF1768 family)
MRAILKDKLLVLVPEHDDEVDAWKIAHAPHVFYLRISEGRELEFHSLGEREDACREPINVVSYSQDPAARLISNFATAPFELDGQWYTSVESFWQGLKLTNASDRRRIARLEGARAQKEGEKLGYTRTIEYGGKEIPVGTWDHWQLMERACSAKFEQNPDALNALLSTGDRPLEHRVRRDSKTIPGVIMADIWMRIRQKQRGQPALLQR